MVITGLSETDVLINKSDGNKKRREVIKAESTKFSLFIPAEACISVLNPILSFEILSIL
jgi:hypothetical protein